MHPVVASRHALIIAQPLLRAVELLLADDGWHGRDRDPFGRVNQPRAALAATGTETYFADAAGLDAFTRAEIERYRRVIAASGARVD